MTPEQRDIVADFRARHIDYAEACGRLAYAGCRDPRTALTPPPAPREQGWAAVYRRTA